MTTGVATTRTDAGARQLFEQRGDSARWRDPARHREVDPEKMSGTPCFTGTRVPIKHLFDYLEGGDSLEVFLDDFPTVTKEQTQGVLEASRQLLLKKYEIAA